MKKLLLIAVAMLFGSQALAEEQTEDRGWYHDRDEALASIQTIAILPADIAVDTPHAERAAELIEAQLAERLAGLGVEVLPASVFRGLNYETKVALGGYYDPFTGDVIEEKLKSITDLTFREFERLHDFQAYFRPVVSVGAAPFSYNTASWHGIEESVTGKTGFWAGTDGYGAVPAISLYGILFTRDETTYFAHPGGIQLARLISGNRFNPVAPELLLADDAKLINAVDIVTAPLLEPMLQPEAQRELEKQQRKEARKAKRRNSISSRADRNKDAADEEEEAEAEADDEDKQ